MTQTQTESPTTDLNKKRPRRNSAFLALMSVHWWMAKLYAILFIGGWVMVEFGENLSFTGFLYDFHKSIAIVTMMLLSWRVIVLLQVWWRKYTKNKPKFTRPWFKKVALHTSLYLFMWVVPVTGIFLSNSYQANNVKLFGLVLPDIFPQNDAALDLARNLHFWFAYLMLAVTILHTVDQWKVVRSWWRRTQNWWQKQGFQKQAE
jgi:cytochrome b561